MKRLFFITAIAVLSFATSSGQGEVKIGVKAGLNLASIGGDVYYAGFGGFDSRTSFHIGALVEIPFTDKISFQPEVLYSSQGSKANFGLNSSGDIKLDYISVPLMGKYHIIAGLSGELGPVIGFLANAKAESVNTNTNTETATTRATTDVKNSYKSIDVAVGIGATYRLPMGFFGSLRYNKGLTDINDASGITAKNQNNVFQVSAGYSF